MPLRLRLFILVPALAAALLSTAFAPCSASGLPLNEVLEKVEARYKGPGFTAMFHQVSTLAAMELTDTADGRVWFAKGGKMRWEYEDPEPQTIVSDGKTLWVYRPLDRQVMTGGAPEFFGEGRGAGFLTDIENVRKAFLISLTDEKGMPKPDGDSGGTDAYTLQLLPRKPTADLQAVRISVDRKLFVVTGVTTINAYGDETRLEFKGIRFLENPAADLFEFAPPSGTDVVGLETP